MRRSALVSGSLAAISSEAKSTLRRKSLKLQINHRFSSFRPAPLYHYYTILSSENRLSLTFSCVVDLLKLTAFFVALVDFIMSSAYMLRFTVAFTFVSNPSWFNRAVCLGQKVATLGEDIAPNRCFTIRYSSISFVRYPFGHRKSHLRSKKWQNLFWSTRNWWNIASAKNRNLRFATALLLSLLEELFSTTQLNFLYFLVELLVKFLLSGTSPVLISFTTVQLISFDISSHYSTSLYSPIEKCCTPAYKGDTKDDTSKLSIFLHRDRSVSASESR